MVQMTMSCPLSLEMSVLRAHSIDSASHSFHLPLFMLTLLVSILQILQIISLSRHSVSQTKHVSEQHKSGEVKNQGRFGSGSGCINFPHLYSAAAVAPFTMSPFY